MVGDGSRIADGVGYGDSTHADRRDRERHPYASERTEEWLSTDPGSGTLDRAAARRDTVTRRWDVVTPSATRIGRPEGPDGDVSENLRRLHDEQHPAMQGHSERMHELDKARITQALCNYLDLTPWERDRALGIVTEIDLTAFGSQRAIPKVALVVIRHVVDAERRARLGLDDQEWLGDQPPERFEDLYDRFESIKDERRFRRLLGRYDLTKTNVNRLQHVLEDQLAEHDLEGAVFGRSPYRDPNLPVVGRAGDASPSDD
ncbi:DNA-directed RNA polymerase subunit epsilon [Halorientalis marina]|uniref:DNA-directed RNA polymerase subunit epsilon n=1 Tax=Halorientalis marina TaxID=2931976 RepID=UPI001FF24864|nr:DNA-directed RNA polymerase subunit epsilon [Halorientalis marina]